jgi:hypothetical protein
MHRFLAIELLFLLPLAAACAGEEKPVVPLPDPSKTGLTAQELAQKAKEALDPKTDSAARNEAISRLAHSGYCIESAEALGAIASDSKYESSARDSAASGLNNFISSIAMPDEVRKSMLDKLRGALEAEKEKLPDSVMRILVGSGEADRIRKALGDRLRGHRMEIEVLQGISSRDEAIARLWELYNVAPPVTGKVGWVQRWLIGAALIQRKDKRGIDILLDCLTVKEPWPIDDTSPRAKESNAGSFRQSLHNTFSLISRTTYEDFGYEGGAWNPQLAEAIPKMVDWWKVHRDTWSFEEATSNVVPTVQPGKPLTKRQIRVLAAKLATDAFSKQEFKHPGGKPVGKIEIKPEYFNGVRQTDGRWVLRMAGSRGPEATVDFALDGSDAKVNVGYAWK